MLRFDLLRGRDWALIAAFAAVGLALLAAWIYWLVWI